MNYKYIKLIGITIFLLSSLIFSQDVILSLDGSSLNYDSTEDIAGFQFNHDGCVTNAGGGDAAANGFLISASGTTVIGFSLTGSVIPAGTGVLIDLGSEDCTETSLSAFIFSDSDGGALTSDFAVAVAGCTDITACNYDSDAEEDDGSCEYIVDCAGECGGNSMLDECGVCDGGNADMDCTGECFGDAGQGFLRLSCAEPDERLLRAIDFIKTAVTRRDRLSSFLEKHPAYRLEIR